MAAAPNTSAGETARRVGALRAVLLLSIAALVVLLYWQNFHAGFVDYDDDFAVENNLMIREISRASLAEMFHSHMMGHWTPLTWLSLALNYRVHGLDPFGYHLVNVLLHAANAALALLLIEALLARACAGVGARARLWAAALGAGFFALHPLRVESVAWVTERRDVLCGLFWIPCVWLYVLAQERGASARQRALRLGLSLVCFALSLVSKAWGITLPAALLALDVWPLGRWQGERKRMLLEKLPFAVLAAAAMWLAGRAQEDVGAAIDFERHSWFRRVLQAGFGLWFYPWKTLWPSGLCMLYPLPIEMSAGEARFAIGLVCVPLATLALVLAARRWPAGLVAWIAFAATVSPVLGFLQSGQQLAADRYTYLACLPFAALFAGAVAHWAQRWRGFAWIALVWVGALGWLAHAQVATWRDSLAMWQRVIEVDPDNYLAYCRRAVGRNKLGDSAGALADFEQAIARYPSLPNAYYLRGSMYRAQRKTDEALRDYGAAIARDARQLRALIERGELLATLKRLPEALADLRAAEALAPQNPYTLYTLAAIQAQLGQRAEALDALQRCLRCAPRGWPYLDRAQKLLAALGG